MITYDILCNLEFFFLLFHYFFSFLVVVSWVLPVTMVSWKIRETLGAGDVRVVGERGVHQAVVALPGELFASEPGG